MRGVRHKHRRQQAAAHPLRTVPIRLGCATNYPALDRILYGRPDDTTLTGQKYCTSLIMRTIGVQNGSIILVSISNGRMILPFGSYIQDTCGRPYPFPYNSRRVMASGLNGAGTCGTHMFSLSCKLVHFYDSYFPVMLGKRSNMV